MKMREELILSEFKGRIGKTEVNDRDIYDSVIAILDYVDINAIESNHKVIELLVGELEYMKSKNEDFILREEEQDILNYIDMHGTIGSVYHRRYEEIQEIIEKLNTDVKIYEVYGGDIDRMFTQSELLDWGIFTDLSLEEIWQPLFDMSNVPTLVMEGEVWNAVMEILFRQLDLGNTITIGEYDITKVEVEKPKKEEEHRILLIDDEDGYATVITLDPQGKDLRELERDIVTTVDENRRTDTCFSIDTVKEAIIRDFNVKEIEFVERNQVSIKIFNVA